MKNGRNSLKQMIESVVNAFCCCDTPDSERIAEIELKYKTLIHFFKEANQECAELRQEILGHEISSDIDNQAWVDKFFSMNGKMNDADQEIYRLRNVDDLNGKRTVQLIAITAALILSSIAATWGWLIVFGIVPI